jgi:hypothetical protein
MPEALYCIGQHNITTLDKALVDRNVDCGIVGVDMLVLEDSEQFFPVSGPACQKVYQLRNFTAPSFGNNT